MSINKLIVIELSQHCNRQINTLKTKIISNANEEVNIKLVDTNVEQVGQYKYLGKLLKPKR